MVNNKKVVAVIPARMAASRFPGKPLAELFGLPMIEHVRRRVSLCSSIDDVIVATCDEAIEKVVHGFGGRVIMTSDKHVRCTDRVAEAISGVDADIVVNVQGDEPTVLPAQLDVLVDEFRKNELLKCANLAAPLTVDELANKDIVKVVFDTDHYALYFSRQPIPTIVDRNAPCSMWAQLGIIAFTKDFLIEYNEMESTPLEKAEGVDMLRVLEKGHRLKMVPVDKLPISVDTTVDLSRAEKYLQEEDLFLREYLNIET